MRSILLKSLLLTAALVPVALQHAARAEVKLPALISDNMVLQQEARANVWGWADPGELVTVWFADRSVTTVADSEGAWSVQFEALTAGTTGDLTISGGKTRITGGKTRIIKNVLVGEVWVCAGQTPMEVTVRAIDQGTGELSQADLPKLRMFTVEKAASHLPSNRCEGRWQVCTPQNARDFSATGYFFGRELMQHLDSPVGLILATAGDAPAENWTPEEALRADPQLAKVFDGGPSQKSRAEPVKPTTGAPVPAEQDLGATQTGPASFFNGMIAPLTPYTIQGALWQPGAADIRQAHRHRRLFPALIASWRQAWGRELPFLFLQLGGTVPEAQERNAPPRESKWAELREAQRLTLDLRHTAMAVSIDLAEGIPPKDRQEIGRRLALAAAATVYYRETSYSGPMLSSSQEELGKIRLSFLHARNLQAADGGKLKGFAIAGEDGRFVWADAQIDGDHVMVSHPLIPQPAAVRYGWADNPDCNLINEDGLPASPFRTDWLEGLGSGQTAVPRDGAGKPR